ncbi:TRAP transporter substrate-binding protein [Fodinicurvata sp. EGI_FJ10296]|uniref:TRAP transporter substrate-binding protein n=1 Tax=Fodinicurvata sp. EGI_FJ10296 TaxID=3231908 RepID=UPI00345603D8
MTILRTALGGAAAIALLSSGAAAQDLTFDLGHSLASDSHYGDGYQAFADTIAELSDGSIEIVEQPASALGGERDMIEGLQIGSVDLVITSSGPLGNFVPDVLVLDLPFLFRDYDHARGVLDGEIGQEMLDGMAEQDLIGLAWSENGFRHLTNSVRPVETPEDMQGLQIRTMENEVHMRAFEAAGVAPTPMAWPEVFTALQQGTVDGQENPIAVITAANFHEVQDYLTLTGHVYSPAIVLMSPFSWDQLNDEQKGWFREAAKASAEATRERVLSEERDGVDQLRELGVEVVEEVDKAAFQEAVSPAYEVFADRFDQDLIERIQNWGLD